MADNGSPLIELLAKVDFFADASTPALERVASRSHERQLSRGETLFAEGDTPHFLFIVVTGRIAIVMSSEVDDRESVVALMEDGDLFGELGLLDDGPRSAGARALSVSTVLEIPFEAVRDMLDEDPALVGQALLLLGAIHEVTIPEEEEILRAIEDERARQAADAGEDAIGEDPGGPYVM